MDQTPRLFLPYIMPSQAQKHITHNEAIQALDALVQSAVDSRTLTEPPASPLDGQAYLVPAGASGAWTGHADEIASWQAGAWQFYHPMPGWQVFCTANQTQYVFDSGAWCPLASLAAGLPQLGINTQADGTNCLAVAGAATLLTHAGNGHQIKINKAAAADTASLLYQTNWSGRAEMGLAGDDSWRLKVSADGTGWVTALAVAPGTGVVSVGASLRPAADNAVTLGASGARWSAVWSATGVIQTSDIRQKSDIAPSDLGLDFILSLEPVRFRLAAGPEGEAQRMHYGLVAQQVQAALEGRDFAGHVLADPADPDSAQGLRYEAFIAPLIAAVQTLARMVAERQA